LFDPKWPGRYAILDMEEYEKTQATIKLMNELSKGKRSGEEYGWIDAGDVRAHFQSKTNEE